MPLKQQADSLLRRGVEAGDVPGVALATHAEGTLYEGAFGKRVVGGAQPMTLDTVGWIASLTKSITAAGAMQLIEQGRLDLELPRVDGRPNSDRCRCSRALMLKERCACARPASRSRCGICLRIPRALAYEPLQSPSKSTTRIASVPRV